ncbi:MAG: efflux RND transporter periplasmic adaptor subunit [Deltaproteobacteria bacterium HGW-Deltaproteobacteria-6]|nr:MAG: efflux RND transporter periplasmic adaptor subunit [Deltaproteobacteria bacterium HGW-Deltaproteobacteria-6]
MKKRKDDRNPFFSGWLFILLLLITACSEEKEPASPRPAVAVEALQAAAGRWTEGIRVTGNLTPKYEVAVKSEIMGAVSQVYVNEWTRVGKGTPLARIDDREQESVLRKAEAAAAAARASELQARVTDNRARREMERMQKLKEAGLATRQQVEDSETEAEASVSRVEAAKAQTRAAGEDLRQAKIRFTKCLITSPIDGVVSLRKVSPGDLVGETGTDKTLFHVVDNRILNLTASVPSTEMAGLRTGQQIHFTTDAFPGRTFTGKIKFINPSVSESDRSVKIIAEVKNEPQVLKGGLFVKGYIITSIRENVLQVQHSALIGRKDAPGGKLGILVVEGETARLRPVTVGGRSGDAVEIQSGLKAGEWYIVRGGFNVKDNDRLAVTRRTGRTP